MDPVVRTRHFDPVDLLRGLGVAATQRAARLIHRDIFLDAVVLETKVIDAIRRGSEFVREAVRYRGEAHANRRLASVLNEGLRCSNMKTPNPERTRRRRRRL